MTLLEQELPTLPDHLCSLAIFNGVRITRSCLTHRNVIQVQITPIMKTQWIQLELDVNYS